MTSALESAGPKQDAVEHGGSTSPFTGSSLRLVPGRNCVGTPRADRIAVLADGDAYFPAVRRSLVRAHHSIEIAAWDIHSGVELARGADDADSQNDGLPTALGPLLVALLDRRPGLRVFILLWDYAPIYALEREPLLFGDAPWGTIRSTRGCTSSKTTPTR